MYRTLTGQVYNAFIVFLSEISHCTRTVQQAEEGSGSCKIDSVCHFIVSKDDTMHCIEDGAGVCT